MRGEKLIIQVGRTCSADYSLFLNFFNFKNSHSSSFKYLIEKNKIMTYKVSYLKQLVWDIV